MIDLDSKQVIFASKAYLLTDTISVVTAVRLVFFETMSYIGLQCFWSYNHGIIVPLWLLLFLLSFVIHILHDTQPLLHSSENCIQKYFWCLFCIWEYRISTFCIHYMLLYPINCGFRKCTSMSWRKLEGAQRVHISTKWIFLQLLCRVGEGDGAPLKLNLYLKPFLK